MGLMPDRHEFDPRSDRNGPDASPATIYPMCPEGALVATHVIPLLRVSALCPDVAVLDAVCCATRCIVFTVAPADSR